MFFRKLILRRIKLMKYPCVVTQVIRLFPMRFDSIQIFFHFISLFVHYLNIKGKYLNIITVFIKWDTKIIDIKDIFLYNGIEPKDPTHQFQFMFHHRKTVLR